MIIGIIENANSVSIKAKTELAVQEKTRHEYCVDHLAQIVFDECSNLVKNIKPCQTKFTYTLMKKDLIDMYKSFYSYVPFLEKIAIDIDEAFTVVRAMLKAAGYSSFHWSFYSDNWCYQSGKYAYLDFSV